MNSKQIGIIAEMTYCCRATWERDDVSLELLDTAGDVSPIITRQDQVQGDVMFS